ncbi:MAG: putative Beta-phosphoglucomutase [Acidobacteria bacterium]|nr:putative Beta-phosphoglucomutase [Acidobacteriota bacterium]
MIQAIFFDFNGVIIDDEPLQLKAYQEVLAAVEISLTEEQYYASMGMDDKAFLRAAFKRGDKELTEAMMQQSMDQKSAIHRRLIENELPLFPGVVTFLKTYSRRYQLGLVSMARRMEIEYVLERARLAKLFSIIVSAEEVTNCKPAPECYELGFAKMNAIRGGKRQPNLLPQECLVIEDAAQGIAAGRAAGMRTLGVTNTIAEATLRTAHAEVVTRSLADWTVDAVELLYV